jgi:hypothetical protein
MLPKQVVSEVQKRVPFNFNMGLHTRLWKHFQLHPARWVAPDGGETVSEFCIPDEPTRVYIYTPAWVDKIVKEIGTPEKFEAFFGTPSRKDKVTKIGAAPSKQEQAKAADSETATS